MISIISAPGRALQADIGKMSPDQAMQKISQVSTTGMVPFGELLAMKMQLDRMKQAAGVGGQGQAPSSTVMQDMKNQEQQHAAGLAGIPLSASMFGQQQPHPMLGGPPQPMQGQPPPMQQNPMMQQGQQMHMARGGLVAFSGASDGSYVRNYWDRALGNNGVPDEAWADDYVPRNADVTMGADTAETIGADVAPEAVATDSLKLRPPRGPYAGKVSKEAAEWAAGRGAPASSVAGDAVAGDVVAAASKVGGLRALAPTILKGGILPAAAMMGASDIYHGGSVPTDDMYRYYEGLIDDPARTPGRERNAWNDAGIRALGTAHRYATLGLGGPGGVFDQWRNSHPVTAAAQDANKDRDLSPNNQVYMPPPDIKILGAGGINGFGMPRAPDMTATKQAYVDAKKGLLTPESRDAASAAVEAEYKKNGIGDAAKLAQEQVGARTAREAENYKQQKWSALAAMGFTMAQAASGRGEHATNFMGALAAGGAEGNKQLQEAAKEHQKAFIDNQNAQLAAQQMGEQVKMGMMNASDKRFTASASAAQRTQQRLDTAAANYDHNRVLLYGDQVHAAAEMAKYGMTVKQQQVVAGLQQAAVDAKNAVNKVGPNDPKYPQLQANYQGILRTMEDVVGAGSGQRIVAQATAAEKWMGLPQVQMAEAAINAEGDPEKKKVLINQLATKKRQFFADALGDGTGGGSVGGGSGPSLVYQNGKLVPAEDR